MIKRANRTWYNPLIVFGFALIIISSCKKKEDSFKVTDIDGNVYDTIHIGTQIWLKQNLRTTRYNNGDLIGTTIPATLNISSESNPKYQWAYAGDESNVATYGRLYTWFAVTDSRNVCPIGWKVPSVVDEWWTLTTYLGGESIAGGKLKEIGNTHWTYPSTGATDEYGFTALPGGGRYGDGTFYNIGNYGFWWTSSENSATDAWSMRMGNDGSYVYGSYPSKQDGFSVRCLWDKDI